MHLAGNEMTKTPRKRVGISVSGRSPEQAKVDVAAAQVRASYAGDPLNIAKRPLKHADDEMRAMAKIRKSIKSKERHNGEGVMISGTGLTEGKFREPTISRLIAKGKIGGVEMQAIEEIDRVYSQVCSGLFLKGYEIKERGDRSTNHDAPSWFSGAYRDRYKPWADTWSKRKFTHSDKTLEIVFDILFSSMSGREIDAREGWKHGTAITVFINGVRDYSAHAGWADRNTAQQWKAVARSFFPMRRMRASAA